MATEIVESLVEGGKASAAPPLGPALGPLKINIGEVVSKINEKTASFKGMQVPIKVIVDTVTKKFEIEVGTPPTAELIKKETGIKKGSGNPLADKVADLKIEQAIKISKMKEDSIMGVGTKNKVKEVMGTCNSMGVMVEGLPAKEAIAQLNAGKFDAQISSGKTELSAEELKEQEAEKKKLTEESEKRHADEAATANQIVSEMKGKAASAIKNKLIEAGISTTMITKVLIDVEKDVKSKEAVAK